MTSGIPQIGIHPCLYACLITDTDAECQSRLLKSVGGVHFGTISLEEFGEHNRREGKEKVTQWTAMLHLTHANITYSSSNCQLRHSYLYLAGPPNPPNLCDLSCLPPSASLMAPTTNSPSVTIHRIFLQLNYNT